MKTNKRPAPIRTHEGAVAKHISAESQLRRSVMSCLLWEKEFYESGEQITDRIKSLIPRVDPKKVSDIAIEARHSMHLRHVPLFIARVMASLPSHRHLVSETLHSVISRPDELTEFVSIYWKDGRQPLAAQVKKGLAKAFTKFSAFSLAKYNRDAAVKLRDVLFLCHAKPKDESQAADWKRLVDGTLPIPDTWETALSAGADKKDTWTRLIGEQKLGGLALLRNLRNMTQVGVHRDTIREAIRTMSTSRILPFRFIAAATHAPYLEPELENAMFRNLEDHPKLLGETILMVDVSGSMFSKMSAKSDLTRFDAACGLAMLLREVCASVQILTFSNKLVEVPPRRGFALRDAINSSQSHSGTDLRQAISFVNAASGIGNHRLIVISDEQAATRVPDPKARLAYMINVASNRNGIGYGAWEHIDGFSESIVSYITQVENQH